MKKRIALLSILVVLSLGIWLGMVVWRINQPTFENFQKYEYDFVLIKNFLIDYSLARNDASRLIVDMSNQFLTVSGEKISDSTIEDSVKTIYEKGFTYIEINHDSIIFWKDETGYYGVLWSSNPQKAISQKVEDARPYMNMKSRKLSNEWYEIGALDSI